MSFKNKFGKLFDPLKLREYYIYEDTLKTIVCIVSGILTGIFNILSGILIVYFFSNLIFSNYTPGILSMLAILISGIPAGYAMLELCVIVIDGILAGTIVENYSYVRLLLLASICFYIIIFITTSFSFIILTSQTKLFNL